MKSCRYALGMMYMGIMMLVGGAAWAGQQFATLVPNGPEVYWDLDLDPDLGVSIRIDAPDGLRDLMFKAGEQPYFPKSGVLLAPGRYQYEMVVIPGMGFHKRTTSGTGGSSQRDSKKADSRYGRVQTGHFMVDDAGYVIDYASIKEE